MTDAQRRRKGQAPNPRQRAFGGNLDMRAAQTEPGVNRPIPLPHWRGSALEARLNANPPEMAECRCPMAGSVAMERNNGKR